MKKNRVIQFSLVIAIIILFFTTYYPGNKDKIIDANKNSSTENASKLTKETSNIIAVSYTHLTLPTNREV